MNKTIIYLLLVLMTVSVSCTKWLEVLPKNEQITPNFWKTKEDVAAVLGAGYLRLRNAVPTIVNWSELRGGSVYAANSVTLQKFQNFQITSLDRIADWALFYEMIGMANSVITYGPEVQEIDETYLEVAMRSDLTEAYFLRALGHFYLLRNFKEIPIITMPYVDDLAPFEVAKSNEGEVVAQIKADIVTALESGAAKEFFDSNSWEGASKGRATKWALYALMADVCLWNGDYVECVEYTDLLMNATATRRPAFIVSSDQWFEIFYPGNSNEAIFEINWSGEGGLGQTAGSTSAIFTTAPAAEYRYSEKMGERLLAETDLGSVRARWGAYLDLNNFGEPEDFRVWKYWGMGMEDAAAVRPFSDGNWIVYRMADIILMKAEALICQGAGHYAEAKELMDRVRTRAAMPALTLDAVSAEELEMLEAVFNERDMEFATEGKRWYDLLRFSRLQDGRYKQQVIEKIVENSMTGNERWIRSALANDYAWYLPIFENELIANTLLVQNPYYGTTPN